jgi:hypothetical protein
MDSLFQNEAKLASEPQICTKNLKFAQKAKILKKSQNSPKKRKFAEKVKIRPKRQICFSVVPKRNIQELVLERPDRNLRKNEAHDQKPAGFTRFEAFLGFNVLKFDNRDSRIRFCALKRASNLSLGPKFCPCN